MTKLEIETFEKTHGQIEDLHSEISLLSKKAPDDALNKFKLKFVNQILHEANIILGTAYRPFSEFEQFNEIDLPTNSDVAMMLAQYMGCFEKLRNNNIDEAYGTWYWKIDGTISDVRVSSTKNLKGK